MNSCVACDGTCGKPKVDSIVTSVINKFEYRSQVGQQKYGTTLDRTDLKFLDWTVHMQEELMDAILYLEKMKKVAGETAKRKCTPCNETGVDMFDPTQDCRICHGKKYVD